MQTSRALVAVTALACAAGAAIWWRASGRPATTGSDHAAAPVPDDRATGARPVASRGSPDHAARRAQPRSPDPAPVEERATGAPASTAPADAAHAGHQPSGPGADVALAWPVTRAVADAGSGGTAPGEPAVPTRVAFRALWYLGADPQAEKTWSRAINDPSQPAGVRSDLIVDMTDEGYTDNDHPTKDDLPLILARLEIIERHAPHAMDRVNADAFAEAYRHLLALYIRLGGQSRRRG